MTTTDGAGINVGTFLGIVNARGESADIGFTDQMVSVQRQLHGQALALGANGIIGLRIESNGYSCFGYGTAVIIEPKPADGEVRPAADEAEMIAKPAAPRNAEKARKAPPSRADEGSGYVFPAIPQA